MSKNDNYIEEILNIIKTSLNNDIKNDSKNLIYKNAYFNNNILFFI